MASSHVTVAGAALEVAGVSLTVASAALEVAGVIFAEF